jgi:hypothetical protein
MILHTPTRSHCKRGHPMSGDNLTYDNRGYCQCKACHLLTNKRAAQARVANGYHQTKSPGGAAYFTGEPQRAEHWKRVRLPDYMVNMKAEYVVRLVIVNFARQMGHMPSVALCSPEMVVDCGDVVCRCPNPARGEPAISSPAVFYVR